MGTGQPQHQYHQHPYGPLLLARATVLCEDGKAGKGRETTNNCRGEVQVSIYKKTTPDTCSSIAVGVVHQDPRGQERTRRDGVRGTVDKVERWPAVLFVKERHRRESVVQATNYKIGAMLSRALEVSPRCVVAPSYSAPRPSSSRELAVGSAAWQLWQQKEQAFEEWKGRMEARRRAGEDAEILRPSSHDWWQLEEAVRYLPEGNTCAARVVGSDGGDVDSSLRAKLRRAASRSPTGTLHLWDVLVLAQCCQREIREGGEGWEGCAGQLLPSFSCGEEGEDALTREEVRHLLEDKLRGPEVEASLLFCAITAQPDSHHYNLGVREVARKMSDDDTRSSGWGLALVHFDTGTLPVHAGVHLDSCEYLYDGHERNSLHAGWAFDGDVDCRGYYYPTLAQLIEDDWRLSARGARGLLRLEGSAVRSLIEREYKALESKGGGDDGGGMTGLGAIVEARIRIMQAAVREAVPGEANRGDIGAVTAKIGLRDLCFRACRAWERDWSSSLLDDIGETLVWMKCWVRTGAV